MPEAVRIEPPRFALRLAAHLRAWAKEHEVPHHGVFLDDIDQTIVSSARPVLARLVEERLDHRFLHHLRSSQRFAVNLFGGLTIDQATAVARVVDPEVVFAERPILEFGDAADRLGERTAASPHTTQVDVALRAHTGRGEVHLLLVEVKLSEDDFGGCSAYQHAENDRLELCATPKPFGGDPNGCFQLRNKDTGARRTYDRWLGELPALPGAGCPFRASGNQPMRNVALGNALLAAGEADRVTFALCAHDGHRSIWRRWQDVQRHLSGTAVCFADLPASSVLAQRDPDDAAFLAAQYDLPDQPAEDRLGQAIGWAQTVLQRVGGDGSVLEHARADGPPDAAARRLAQRLESLAELARATREHLVPPVIDRTG